MSRIVRYFPNSDLRASHKGLTDKALRAGVNPRNIPLGEFLLFVNKSQTMFKMMTQNNVLLFYKSATGKLHPAIFALVPKYFAGREFNYDGALREAVMSDYRTARATTARSYWREMTGAEA